MADRMEAVEGTTKRPVAGVIKSSHADVLIRRQLTAGQGRKREDWESHARRQHRLGAGQKVRC